MNWLRLLHRSPRSTFNEVPKGYYHEVFSRLESESPASEFEQHYLWPRTPTHDIQSAIQQRVGVSDYEIDSTESRPSRIVEQVCRLRSSEQLPERFSALDIACGDGLILWHLKKRFAEAECMGIDCNKGKFREHDRVTKGGVFLYNVYIQNLFRTPLDHRLDLVLMLNTYRGWESADLREHEQSLPDEADRWLLRNARFVILTAKRRQVAKLKRIGFHSRRMGKGEDDSVMVCLSRRV